MKYPTFIKTNCMLMLIAAAGACDLASEADIEFTAEDVQVFDAEQPLRIDPAATPEDRALAEDVVIEVMELEEGDAPPALDLDLTDAPDVSAICLNVPQGGPQSFALCGSCFDGHVFTGRVKRQYYRTCNTCTKICGAWTWVENCVSC